jgi:hypothetical protein
MLISTWDGDEYSVGAYLEVIRKVLKNPQDFLKLKSDFQQKLTSLLNRYPIREINLNSGYGYFSGEIPFKIAKYFKYYQGKYIVCPSKSAMEDFLNE